MTLAAQGRHCHLEISDTLGSEVEEEDEQTSNILHTYFEDEDLFPSLAGSIGDRFAFVPGL